MIPQPHSVPTLLQSTAPDDRAHSDRRRPASLFSWHALAGGRRVAPRRIEDRPGAIVDQHGMGLFAAVLTVVLFNVLDAFFTILFLSYGGTEMNPFVDWVLVHGGVFPFLMIKSLGIGACVAFLTLTKYFTVSRIGLVLVLVGYGVLMGWHLYLLGHLPG